MFCWVFMKEACNLARLLPPGNVWPLLLWDILLAKNQVQTHTTLGSCITYGNGYRLKWHGRGPGPISIMDGGGPWFHLQFHFQTSPCTPTRNRFKRRPFFKSASPRLLSQPMSMMWSSISDRLRVACKNRRWISLSELCLTWKIHSFTNARLSMPMNWPHMAAPVLSPRRITWQLGAESWRLFTLSTEIF